MKFLKRSCSKAQLCCCLVGLLTMGLCWGSVKSTSGSIRFKLGDQTPMVLNTVGLGIQVQDPVARLHVQGNSIISESLHVGGAGVASSNLQVQGSMSLSVANVEANHYLGEHSVVLANTASNNVTLYLPKASVCPGQMMTIKKSSALNRLTLLSSRIDGLDGGRGLLAQPSVGVLPSVSLLSDGQRWLQMEGYGDWSSANVFSDNLVGWWNFSDGVDDTTLEDLSVNDNHGRLIGGITLSGNAAAGNLGGGIDFDGQNDGVVIDQFPIQNGEPVTFSCWTKYVYRGSTATQTLVSYRKSGHGRFSLSFYRHDYLYLDDFSGTNYKFLRVQPGDLRLEKDWLHIVFSFDSQGGRRLWVNGVEKTVTNRGGDVGNTEGRFTIGCRAGSQRFKEGPIEDVKLYNRTFEHDEVLQLYEAGRFR